LFRGHVSAHIDTETWECDGPCAITIHPSVVHGFHFSSKTYGYVLTMDQNVLLGQRSDGDGKLFSGLFLQPLALDLSTAKDARARIEALLRHLLEEFSKPQQGHILMLDWLTRCVMLLLARCHADHRSADLSGRADFELFGRLRASIEENYKAQWPVARYAAALHVTQSRLDRLCARLAGKSTFDLVLQRLMLEACRKLTYIPANISSIAYELGFQDPAYFSRAFKRHTGLTPKMFREQTRLEGTAANDMKPGRFNSAI
jgi:AraC family transcriptional activator of pobA